MSLIVSKGVTVNEIHYLWEVLAEKVREVSNTITQDMNKINETNEDPALLARISNIMRKHTAAIAISGKALEATRLVLKSREYLLTTTVEKGHSNLVDDLENLVLLNTKSKLEQALKDLDSL